MATNNTYIVNQLATSGNPVATDNGGIDWLEFSSSFTSPGEIYLNGWMSTTEFYPPTTFAYADYQTHRLAVRVVGIIENARGGNGADTVAGNEFANRLYGDHAASGAGGADTLFGLKGNDQIFGGAGNDSISGGSGNDSLTGGAGTDKLLGGTGADRFIFSAASQSAPGVSRRDTISDFHHSEGDKIDLRGIDAKSGTPGVNDAFSFVGTGAFSTAGKLRIVDIGSDMVVYGDTNGDRAADFAILVKNINTLVAGDFLL